MADKIKVTAVGKGTGTLTVSNNLVDSLPSSHYVIDAILEFIRRKQEYKEIRNSSDNTDGGGHTDNFVVYICIHLHLWFTST